MWRIWLVGQEPLSLKDQSDVPHEKASSQLLLLVKYQLWDLTLVTWQHALMTHVEPLVQMLSASECIISNLSSNSMILTGDINVFFVAKLLYSLS